MTSYLPICHSHCTRAWAFAEIFPGGNSVNNLLNFLRLLKMQQCRWTFAKHFSVTTRLHHKKMPYVTVVTKNALLWQPSQVYSDHIQNRVSSNFESMVLIFTEVLPWSLNNQQIMTLFYLARRVSSVATRVSLVQIVAFFNIRFFRRVSNKLNASFTNT